MAASPAASEAVKRDIGLLTVLLDVGLLKVYQSQGVGVRSQPLRLVP